MIVRQEQLRQIERQHTDQFESDAMALLREEFPERCSAISDEDLLVSIRAAKTRAQKDYAITEEDALLKFVYLSWLLGEDFDCIPLHSWIRDILRHRRPASERMEIIMSGVIHHLDAEDGMLRVIEEPDDDISPR